MTTEEKIYLEIKGKGKDLESLVSLLKVVDNKGLTHKLDRIIMRGEPKHYSINTCRPRWAEELCSFRICRRRGCGFGKLYYLKPSYNRASEHIGYKLIVKKVSSFSSQNFEEVCCFLKKLESDSEAYFLKKGIDEENINISIQDGEILLKEVLSKSPKDMSMDIFISKRIVSEGSDGLWSFNHTIFKIQAVCGQAGVFSFQLSTCPFRFDQYVDIFELLAEFFLSKNFIVERKYELK